jgi:hypothetical protein
MRTEPVQRLTKACTYQELEGYYDRITARARRTEIGMGLAYSVLVALLTTERHGSPIDTSRLKWGPVIEELVQKSGMISQSSYLIQVPTSRPTITQQNNKGSGLISFQQSAISPINKGEFE